MGIGKQFETLKDNWLLIVLALAALFVISGLMSGIGSIGNFASKSLSMTDSSYRSASMGGSYENYYAPGTSQNFAPDVQERKITKSASLSAEVENGNFGAADSLLKSIVSSSGSYLLNQNVNKYGAGKNTYSTGSYSIKVDTAKYDSVVAQLKQIGEVKSFNENTADITGSYTDLNVELTAEKARLARYQQMYSQTNLVGDKITINNNMFDLERQISYMEERLKNMDNQVEYSTLTVTLSEKQHDYASIVFAKFSDLVKTLVGSMNSLFYLVFALLPYAVAIFIVWIIVRMIRKH
jgi:hypothetical protein